jgi:quercetin dioxygenase-like cupin family protein
MSAFEHLSKVRPHLLRDGIKARAVNGERVTMAVIDLEPHAISPEHSHENEQLGFVIAGTMTMRIGSEKRELRPGDTYAIPPNIPHEAIAGPDGATATDIFAPVRADWAEMKRGEPGPGNWP